LNLPRTDELLSNFKARPQRVLLLKGRRRFCAAAVLFETMQPGIPLAYRQTGIPVYIGEE
jgi:hypothetical protein